MPNGSLTQMFKRALAIALLVAGTFPAAAKEMECREWVDNEYRGLYEISFDQQSNDLTVRQQPEGSKNYLFGRGVKEWNVLWTTDHNLVAMGIVSEDWRGPVKLLSLDFSNVRMFEYELGGATEGDTVLSEVQRKCRRMD